MTTSYEERTGTVEKSPGEEADAVAPRSPRSRAFVLTAALSLALLVGCLLSAAIGAYSIPLGDVLSSVQHRIGLGGQELDRVGESVLWNVRLPGSSSPCSSGPPSAVRAP